MPRPVPRYAPMVGKCHYCGDGVRSYQAVRIDDPSVIMGVPGTPVRRLVHSAASGYACEGEVRGRFERTKLAKEFRSGKEN